MSTHPSEALYEELLKQLRIDKRVVSVALQETLVMMVAGLLLSRNVQLCWIALWLPFVVQQTSLVRRFEAWLANPKVNIRALFKPFVIAMETCLGSQEAYLVMDCTKAGRKCRTLMIGLVYHQTVLPLCWKTVKGKKGHLKGEHHKALLAEAYDLLGRYRRVVVLGDAEFSNETLISWFRDKRRWFFVFRFQESYLVNCSGDPRWLSAQEWRQEAQISQGGLRHFEGITFTDTHQLTDLTMTIQWEQSEPKPLYLVSNLASCECPHWLYEMRFWIETLFANFKSRGFQLDQTHLTKPEQIDQLLLVVAIATCIVLQVGTEIWLIGEQKSIDRSDRRDLSLFQLGLRGIVRLLVEKRFKLNRFHLDWGFQLPPPGFQKP